MVNTQGQIDVGMAEKNGMTFQSYLHSPTVRLATVGVRPDRSGRINGRENVETRFKVAARRMGKWKDQSRDPHYSHQP
jgi:hypothetical protein